MRRAVIIFPLLLLPGCATQGNFVNGLWSKMFGRKAEAVAKTEVKADKLEDREVTAAHVEVVKTGTLLAAAATEHPDSRPVAMASRTNQNAADLLNHRDPLSVATIDGAVSIARGLLSAETAARAHAESAQATAEGTNRQLSEQLSQTRVELKKLSAERDAEARNNLSLANQLRTERFYKYACAAASTILGLAAIAYRLNIGRFQGAAASVLDRIKAQHGDAAADTARTALDTVLHTGEQRGVAKAFFALQQAKPS